MSKSLYRYISFEDFVNLAINNKERYVRPASWKDEYEGYLFTHMETPEDVRKIVSEMYYNLCHMNYYAIPDNYFRMWHSKWFTYAQCWTSRAQTDAMWRCYAYDNKAIRIRTKEDKLLDHATKIFPKEKLFSVYLQKVSYDLNKKSAIERQISQMKDSLLAHETYFHKRPAFRHEGEYRLLVADNSLYDIEGLSSFGVKFKIGENIKDMNNEEKIDYLTSKICSQRADWERNAIENVRLEDAGDLSEFLEGVMVHPLAQQWYVDIVRDICQSRKIKFEGQSALYRLK